MCGVNFFGPASLSPSYRAQFLIWALVRLGNSFITQGPLCLAQGGKIFCPLYSMGVLGVGAPYGSFFEPFSFNQVSVIPSGPGNTKYKIQDVLWGGAGEDLPRHNNLTDLTPPNQQCHTVLGPDN